MSAQGMNVIAPIEPKERLDILDILRGFAVLGIIFNNIQYFSGYTFVPTQDLAIFRHFELNERVYHWLDIVVTAKFYTMFSLLFAVGFSIQFSRYREEHVDFIRTYRRRLVILLLIGVIHSLIWYGDILFLYGVVGSVLMLFRNVGSRNLLKWSLFFFALPFLLDLLLLVFYMGPSPAGSDPISSPAHSNFPGMSARVLSDTLIHGNARELFSLNLYLLKWKWMGYIPAGRLPTTLGIFLLGYHLGSIGFFREKSKSAILLVGSFLIGIVATLAARGMGGDVYMFPSSLANMPYKFLLLTGQLSMSLFYIVAIIGIVRIKAGKAIMNSLKPVGRMALTNYIMQTFLCTLIFGNHGLDLICRIEYVYAVVIAVSILAFQILFSHIWLRFYHYGPLEWVWRSLTYRRAVVLKK